MPRTRTANNITVSLPDKEIVNDYLDQAMSRSTNSYWAVRKCLFLLYDNAPVSVEDMTYTDLDSVVSAINASPWKQNVKYQRWSTVKAYYEFCPANRN
jgi:hypothetical protein